MNDEPKKSITVTVPQSEADAVYDKARRMGISVTMVVRMVIRESLMHDPIVLEDV